MRSPSASPTPSTPPSPPGQHDRHQGRRAGTPPCRARHPGRAARDTVPVGRLPARRCLNFAQALPVSTVCCSTTVAYDRDVERISVRELRQHANRYLDRIKAGESIEVTERGTPVAVLIPAMRDEVRERLVQDGRLIHARGPRVLPEPVETSDPSTGAVLDELRADRCDLRSTPPAYESSQDHEQPTERQPSGSGCAFVQQEQGVGRQ